MDDLLRFQEHPADSVEYTIHVVNSSISELQKRDLLRSIHSASRALCKKHLATYIWHTEEFVLNLVHRDGATFLRGITAFGDSLEDEYLVVYLLSELSKQFDAAWIQVTDDSDGEFLLTEAAHVLPEWLSPQVAENRVWLNQGHLYIIPQSESPCIDNEPRNHLTRAQALRFIETNRRRLLHLEEVENEAFFRVRRYPEQIAQNLHHAQIVLPRSLAFILHLNPSYISPAIRAFHVGDPTAKRALREKDTTELLFPPKDLVRGPALFTKIGFAQVKSQPFSALPTWEREVLEQRKDLTAAEVEVGMKVSSGFELLMSNQRYQDHRVVREINIVLEDIETNEMKLPSDDEIRKWGSFANDESWLDINYEDLEKELSGKAAQGDQEGFGDPSTLENLKKIVSRYEQLLRDDDSLEDAESSASDGVMEI